MSENRAGRGGFAQFVRKWAAAVVLGAVAMAGVAKVGEDVLAHETTPFDDAVQRWMLAHQSPALDTTFLWVTRLGGVAPMTLLAVLGAAFLWRRGRQRLATGVLLAPATAVLIFLVVKHLYARPRPVGLGGIVPSSYSFPSGHATASTAICGTLAYVFWRERLLPAPLALLFASLVPLLVGLSRLVLNVHWATDVLGGWSIGLLVAVFSAVFYDRAHRHRAAGVATAEFSQPRHANGVTS